MGKLKAIYKAQECHASREKRGGSFVQGLCVGLTASDL